MRQEAAAGGAVEHDVRIGVVVHDEQVVLTGERDDLVVEGVVAHRPHGVCRQGDDHVLGAIGDGRVDTRHMGQKAVLGVERVIGELGVGDLGPRLEHGVARIGHEDRVAGVEQGEAQVPHALLRAVARRHHVGRDALHAKAAGIVIAHRLLELGQVAQGVLPHLRVGRRARERLDHMRVGGEVRRAHGKVVDGSALLLERDAARVEGGKHLGAKAIETA